MQLKIKYQFLAASIVAVFGLVLAVGVMAFTPPSSNPPYGGGSISVESGAPANSFHIKSNGYVGIGGTDPQNKLHVQGGIGFASPSGGNTWNLSITNDGGALQFNSNSAAPGGDVRMVINDDNGNVGIGTSTPVYKIDVQGGQINTSGGLCIAGDCKTSWSQVGGSISAANVSAGIFGSIAGKGNYTFQAGADTDSVLFIDATNKRVGIGTTSPGQLLHVSQSHDAATYISVANTNTGTAAQAGIDFQADSSNAQIRLIGANYAATPNWADSFVIAPNSSASGGTVIYSSAKVRIQNSAGTDALTVASGSVGIGTTSPGSKLDVQGGDINTSGKLKEGGNALIPSGAVMSFNLSSCPSGWSALDGTGGRPDARGRYIIDLPAGGTLAATVGTALSNQENRAAGQHNHYVFGRLGNEGGGAQFRSLEGNSGNNGLSDTAGTIGNTSVAGTNAPYIQFLVCQKD